MMRMQAEDWANTTGRGPSGKSPAQISQALTSLSVFTSETIRQHLHYIKKFSSTNLNLSAAVSQVWVRTALISSHLNILMGTITARVTPLN